MRVGDLFKRGTLLPKRTSAAEGDRSADDADEDPGVFDRATVVPDEVTATDLQPGSEPAAADANDSGGTQRSPAHPDGLDRRARLESPSIAKALAPDHHPTPPGNSIKLALEAETRLDDNLEAAWSVGAGPLSSSATLDLTPLALEELVASAPEPEPEPESAPESSGTGFAYSALPFGTRDTVGVSGLVPELSDLGTTLPPGAASPSVRPTQMPPSPSRLSDLYAVGDFSGALAQAQARLAEQPGDSEAQVYADKCRSVLTQMYASRLGDLRRPVRLLVPPGKIKWLSIDHRAGFVLSLIDGTSSLEDVLDLCAMPNVEAMRIMVELLEKDIVAVG